MYIVYRDIATVIECAIVFAFLVLFGTYKNKKIWLNKKVILDDRSVKFFSVYNSPHTVGDCVFDFSQVTDITSLWLPFIGIYGVKIRTAEYVNPFKVNYCFENYKDFCVEICKSTIKENKNVYIDKRLSVYVASRLADSSLIDKNE